MRQVEYEVFRSNTVDAIFDLICLGVCQSYLYRNQWRRLEKVKSNWFRRCVVDPKPNADLPAKRSFIHGMVAWPARAFVYLLYNNSIEQCCAEWLIEV